MRTPATVIVVNHTGGLQAAKGGDPQARNWLAQYLVGRPEGNGDKSKGGALVHVRANQALVGMTANWGLLKSGRRASGASRLVKVWRKGSKVLCASGKRGLSLDVEARPRTAWRACARNPPPSGDLAVKVCGISCAIRPPRVCGPPYRCRAGRYP